MRQVFDSHKHSAPVLPPRPASCQMHSAPRPHSLANPLFSAHLHPHLSPAAERTIHAVPNLSFLDSTAGRPHVWASGLLISVLVQIQGTRDPFRLLADLLLHGVKDRLGWTEGKEVAVKRQT